MQNTGRVPHSPAHSKQQSLDLAAVELFRSHQSLKRGCSTSWSTLQYSETRHLPQLCCQGPHAKKPLQKINNAERIQFNSGTLENHPMQAVFCPNQHGASQITAYYTFPIRTASITRSRTVYPCVKASGGNNTKEKRKSVPLDIPKDFFWPLP